MKDCLTSTGTFIHQNPSRRKGSFHVRKAEATSHFSVTATLGRSTEIVSEDSPSLDMSPWSILKVRDWAAGPSGESSAGGY